MITSKLEHHDPGLRQDKFLTGKPLRQTPYCQLRSGRAVTNKISRAFRCGLHNGKAE